MLPCMGKFSKAISKGALLTLESIVSVAPSTDIGICVRLIALSGISSALRPKNMIKSTFGMFGAKERNMYGLQVAPIGTVSENLGGAQVGLFNFAGGGGLQIGLFNRVHGDWRGVQIGVVNWIDDGWILPLVNWRFRQYLIRLWRKSPILP